MLNIALVGCGRIAKRHSELLGFNKIKGARLISVCDSALDKAKLIGDSFGVSYYQDMHQMMSSETIDVVVVLTESGNHAKHVLDLAQYSKHIVVEKPMALLLEDARAMIETCKKKKIKLFVMKQNRFNLPVLKLKQAIDSGRFKKIVLGTVRVRWSRTQAYYDQDVWRGSWALDGGVLTNQASHHIDLLEWMLGEVESVFAKSVTALVNIEAEDTAVVIIKFKNGALGLIEATTAVRPKDIEGSISIMGEGGTVEIGGFAVNEMKVWNFCDQLDDDFEVISKFSVNPPTIYGFGHQAYYEHIVDCITNNNSQLVDGEEGIKSLELIHAIYESIETGKEVNVGGIYSKSRLGA